MIFFVIFFSLSVRAGASCLMLPAASWKAFPVRQEQWTRLADVKRHHQRPPLGVISFGASVFNFPEIILTNATTPNTLYYDKRADKWGCLIWFVPGLCSSLLPGPPLSALAAQPMCIVGGIWSASRFVYTLFRMSRLRVCDDNVSVILQ